MKPVTEVSGDHRHGGFTPGSNWSIHPVCALDAIRGGVCPRGRRRDPGVCCCAPVGGATPEEPEDIPAGTSMKCAGRIAETRAAMTPRRAFVQSRLVLLSSVTAASRRVTGFAAFRAPTRFPPREAVSMLTRPLGTIRRQSGVRPCPRRFAPIAAVPTRTPFRSGRQLAMSVRRT